MLTRIQFRRGSSAEWVNNNPLLLAGELGLELDTRKIKIGNGVDRWIDLPYLSLSAYDIAVSQGFEGSIQEWLESLKSNEILWSSTNW